MATQVRLSWIELIHNVFIELFLYIYVKILIVNKIIYSRYNKKLKISLSILLEKRNNIFRKKK